LQVRVKARIEQQKQQHEKGNDDEKLQDSYRKPRLAAVVACLAAAVIAICAVVVLNKFQRPVETAFATSAVRI